MTEKKTTGKPTAGETATSRWAVVRPATFAGAFNAGGDKLRQLRLTNLVLAAVFALQGVAVLVFGSGDSLPVSVSYFTADPLQSAAQGTTVRTLATHQLFSVSLLAVVALTLFVAAVVHLLLATVYATRYETDLANGTNKLRWLGFAVTTSLLVLGSAMVFGAQDIALLLAVVVLSISQNMAGWAVERHDIAALTRQRLSMAVGGLAGLAGLAILGFYLFGAATYSTATPGYFYGLFVVNVLAYVLFSVNLLLRHRLVGKWADYLHTERMYLVLDLVITSALAWQLFAGALR